MSLRPRVTFTQYRGHGVLTPPAIEPVTADDLRAHLAETVDGLPYDQADDLIATARDMIEETTGIAMINQTWRLALDCWPSQRADWWDGVRQGAIAGKYPQMQKQQEELMAEMLNQDTISFN
jgi:hypothetical protein